MPSKQNFPYARIAREFHVASQRARTWLCIGATWAVGVLKTTPVGFEPTRGDPIGLAGRRLSHSAKVSLDWRAVLRSLYYSRIRHLLAEANLINFSNKASVV